MCRDGDERVQRGGSRGEGERGSEEGSRVPTVRYVQYLVGDGPTARSQTPGGVVESARVGMGT